VRDAITGTITTLPEQLRRSLTWDQGSEMAQRARLRVDTGLVVHFCDPQPVAAGLEREHQWAAATIFPEGDGPECPQRQRSGGSRGGAQQQATEEAPMEDASRGAGCSAAGGSEWCCDDRVKASSTLRRSIER
jgi:hypothetical protein